jgi:hypothetical protein
MTNEITLAAPVRELWDEGRIGLKPLNVSSDRTVLELEFHYLSELYNSPRDLELPPANHSTSEPLLLNSATGAQLHSGDVIRLITPSPKQFPLPSFKFA